MLYTEPINLVNHGLAHPDIHTPMSHFQENETLHVAACYSNPFRWRTRRELANDFRRHMNGSPNVKLYVGELAYGDRPHEITSPQNPNDLQIRTRHELFHKENILNQVIKTFPKDWKYGAWIDMDFHFTRHDWSIEAIHQLQHYSFVQLFSQYGDLSGRTLGTGNRLIGTNNSFAFNYIQNDYCLPQGYGDGGWKTPSSIDDAYYGSTGVVGASAKPHLGVGATGGAWAFTREAFEKVGSLLDVCILGHADWFMTFGLVCEDAPDMHIGNYTNSYRNAIHAWQKNSSKLKKNIGYIDCFATHGFHGSKNRRAYSSRDKILVNNAFDPVTDLRADWQGIYSLTDDKPRLRDQIRQYFISRTEDDPNLYNGR